MEKILNTLQQVETGEYNGIGRRLVALSDQVVLPECIVRPERDNGLGIVSKYMGSAATEAARPINMNLTSPAENGKLVDRRLLAWLLIGREQQRDGLADERFVKTAEGIINRAIEMTADIAGMKILQGAKKSATDWRSLFEGLVKADIFGKDFQPLIVTSLGGYDGEVPLAAPFNVLPGLELASRLMQSGYDPRMTVTSAAKYAIDCNGLQAQGASDNWSRTAEAYLNLVQRFYPELENSFALETLWPGGLDGYPDEVVKAAWDCCESDNSLRQTAEQYGAGTEAFLRYMLSHTQAFRDFQLQAEAPFVIKVGAPSELRFSRWQKLTIEQALPLNTGFVPNSVVDGSKYGQISLYYPRLGKRPPYYPDAQTDEYPEPVLNGVYPESFEDFLWDIPDGNPSLGRYADLQQALDLSRVKPEEYLRLFSGGQNE